MNFRRIVLPVLFMTAVFLSTAMMASAQTEDLTRTEPCDFDLTAVQSLLDEAQAAFDDGQQSTATALLGDVNDQLDVTSFGCDPIPEMIELLFGVGEVLALEVPEAWSMIVPDDDPLDGGMVLILGSDSSVIASRRSVHAGFTQRSGLAPHQKMISIGWLDSHIISRQLQAEGDITLDQAVQQFISLMDLDPEVLTDFETVTIQGWTAQRFVWFDDEAETIYYVIELGLRDGYVHVAATAAPGYSAPLDTLTRFMLETLVFTPPFEP